MRRVLVAACLITFITALTSNSRKSAADVRASATPHAGIERDAEPIADEVDREGGDQDRKPGKEGNPPCAVERLASVREHDAPFWRGWLGAETEKAETGGRQNSSGDAEGSIDD